MKRPVVYQSEGRWWAMLRHDGWDDATPFESWASAFDHACWLAWISNRREAQR